MGKCSSIVWCVLMFISFGIAVVIVEVKIVLLPFKACIGCCSDFLLLFDNVIELPRECAKRMMNGDAILTSP